MYTVLVPLDGDEARARAQAAAVADLPCADEQVQATLVHVFESNPSAASVHQVVGVRRASEYLESRGVSVRLDETSGEPARELLRLADDADVDLICLAGRKRTPAGKALFGSVTQHVILESDRPVLVCDTDGPVTEE